MQLILASNYASQLMLQTVAGAMAGGVLLIFLARKFKFPAIVLLLGGGIALGPAVLGDSAIVQPDSLGDGLRVIVSLAVGLILFEGGLTLDVSGYRSAPRIIKRLLSLGVLITWWATALFVWVIFDLPFVQAVLAGSLVIVTGPTVIAPLLKRIRIEERINSILHWEGVLIDPIGVFIAILCFEAFAGEGSQAALINLLIRVGVGLPLGLMGGIILSVLVKRHIVDEEMLNVFALGMAVLIFALAETVLPETGLLSVTVAGFVFGLSGTAQLKQVRQFKAQITDLLIGTLFILLAARLEFEQFVEGFGLPGIVAVLVLMFIVRPLGIFACSFKTDLTTREKFFLSWIAPRGIVAASLASLVAIRLAEIENIDNPRFVETFTYSVIIATIVVQGLTAGPWARLLGLKRKDPTGWLIVGAHDFARGLAKFFQDVAGQKVILVDTNKRRIEAARREGLIAISRDARDVALAEEPMFHSIGNVLALTDNEDLNQRIGRNWTELFGPEHVFRYDPSAMMVEDAGRFDPNEGHVVWGSLARPSLLAGEIARGEARLIDFTSPRDADNEVVTPLVVFDGKNLLLDPGAAGEEEDTHTLALSRESDYLYRSLRPELFVVSEAKDRESLFGEMVDRVVKLCPQLPRDELVRELVEREKAFPTVLGHGVASPHVYHQDLNVRLCVVARVPGGIAYGARDGKTVSLVFMLLSPQGDPEGHLATLGEIARMMINPRNRLSVMDVESGEEMIRLVRELLTSR